MQFLLFAALSTSAAAQSTFTQYVRKQNAGDGKVTVIQDARIDDVVNNVKTADKKPTDTKPATDKDKKQDGDGQTAGHREGAGEADDARTTHTERQRYRAMGYRIQIFTGSNSRSDKMKAYDIGEKCQKKFPMLSVYPRFISPRWVCRVGDFKTLADAQEYAKKIKAAHLSLEVRIVKCEVLLAR